MNEARKKTSRTAGWRTAGWRSVVLLVSAGLAASWATPVGATEGVPAQPVPAQSAPPPQVTRARAEIIVLHATNDHSGIDPKIGKMPELARPPFSSYDSYKLLDRVEIDLPKGQAQPRKLPDDGQLAVTLKEIVEPTKKGDPVRFSVAASIQKPGGKSFLPALEVSAKKGDIFFIAGQTYKGGILVIGIRVLG